MKKCDKCKNHCSMGDDIGCSFTWCDKEMPQHNNVEDDECREFEPI